MRKRRGSNKPMH